MANLFPESVSEELVIEDVEESDLVQFGRSWEFDYVTGDFALSPTGKIKETGPFKAWIEWCKKSLRTVRYDHLIYSDDYGQEFRDLVSSQLTREANESEIQRMVTESLMINKRTESVDDFSFSWVDDAVYFNFVITSVRGETRDLSEEVAIAI